MPDGKILVAGLSYNTSPIVRLLHDGSLDSTFSSPVFGFVTTMAVQSDGKIVIGGTFTNASGQSQTACLYRLEANGALDAGFTPITDGLVTSVALHPDGRIMVGGGVALDGIPVTRLARLHANGSPDLTFTPQMNWYFPVPGTPMVVKPDGKVLIGAFYSNFMTNRSGVFQLLDTGVEDSTFSAPFYGDTGAATSIALQPNGRILVGGSFIGFNGIDTFDVTRLMPDGSVDLSFGIGATHASGGGVSQVLPLPDGKVLVNGYAVPRGVSRYLGTFPDPPDADLEIVKKASTGAMTTGGFVTYTITVRNGIVDAAGVTVSDTLPSGLTHQSCSADLGGKCGGVGNQRTITFGAIAPQANATITLNANVTAAAGATVVNTATVTSYSPDPVSSNNSSAATSYRNPPQLADLRIIKSATPSTATPGNTLTYTLTVVNDGPNTATSVVVTDTLPSSVTFNTCNAPSGTCGGSGNARTIAYASMAAGVTRTITLSTTVNGDTTAPIVNTASVSSSTADPRRRGTTAATAIPTATGGPTCRSCPTARIRAASRCATSPKAPPIRSSTSASRC